MIEAFRGGNRIYVVSAVTIGEIRVQQHKNVVDAAIAAGVEHITYTSFLGASDPAYAHVYVTPDHTATEAYIRKRSAETGVEYNFMQDNLYMENYLTTSVMLALMSGNKWYTTAGEGKATFIPKDDCARVATALLLGKGEPGKTYKVCGSESIAQRDIVALINDLSGGGHRVLPGLARGVLRLSQLHAHPARGDGRLLPKPGALVRQRHGHQRGLHRGGAHGRPLRRRRAAHRP